MAVEREIDERKEASRMPVEIKEGERIDDLQRNGYRILQKKERFCFGMDAVLLSGFARVKAGRAGDRSGHGDRASSRSFWRRRRKGDHFTGLEIQEEMAEMAARSVGSTGWKSRLTS